MMEYLLFFGYKTGIGGYPDPKYLTPTMIDLVQTPIDPIFRITSNNELNIWDSDQ